MAGGKLHHSGPLNEENASGSREEPIDPLFCPRIEGRRNVIGGPDVTDVQGHAERRGHLLQRFHL